MTRRVDDITEIIFPMDEESEQEKKERELWSKATQEAYKLVDQKSPIALARKTEEIYKKYLRGE